MRRQRDPHGGPAPVPRREPGARAHGVRVRDRLLEPLPALHEDLRVPRHPRPRVPARRGRQDGAPGPERVREHRRRRLLLDRGRALDPRDPVQHEPDGDPARQPDLRADQEAGVADLADRHQEQHDAPWQRARSAQPADGHARRPERLVRGAGRRLDAGDAVRHHLQGVPPPRLLVRAHHPALPRVAAQDVRAVAARSGQDAAADARQRAAAERRDEPHLQEPARARPAEHPPGARDRLVDRSDPGGHPVSRSERAVLRGPARRRGAADRRGDPRRPRQGIRQVHDLAGRRARTSAPPDHHETRGSSPWTWLQSSRTRRSFT